MAINLKVQEQEAIHLSVEEESLLSLKASEGIIPTGTKSITANGNDIDVKAFASVNVNVHEMTHIGTLPSQTVYLKDTDFNTWTPSTTAATVIATASAGTFTATDIADHDYFIRCRICSDLVYNEGTATSKGRFAKTVGENWYAITRRASNNANLNSSTRNGNVAESITNIWIIQYYNTAWTATYSSSYGFYPANAAPTLSSTSAASPTVTVNRPTITAKCSSTYFSTAMASAIDKAKSSIKFVWDIYRADSWYWRQGIHLSLMDMWNNGLS